MGWRQGRRLRCAPRRGAGHAGTRGPRRRAARAARGDARDAARRRDRARALRPRCARARGVYRRPARTDARDDARAAHASAISRPTLDRSGARGERLSAKCRTRALVDAGRMDREPARVALPRHLPWHRCTHARVAVLAHAGGACFSPRICGDCGVRVSRPRRRALLSRDRGENLRDVDAHGSRNVRAGRGREQGESSARAVRRKSHCVQGSGRTDRGGREAARSQRVRASFESLARVPKSRACVRWRPRARSAMGSPGRPSSRSTSCRESSAPQR